MIVFLFIFIFGLFLIFWLAAVYSFVSVNQAPFISVPKKILSRITATLDLNAGDVVYDLGCGDARVLIAAAREQPRAKFFGLEKNFYPYILAWFNSRTSNNIKIIKKNFFSHNFSDADKIFVYLLPEVMDKLLLKLEQELKAGSQVISCDFEFKSKKPLTVVDLNRGGKRGQKLFVYGF